MYIDLLLARGVMSRRAAVHSDFTQYPPCPALQTTISHPTEWENPRSKVEPQAELPVNMYQEALKGLQELWRNPVCGAIVLGISNLRVVAADTGASDGGETVVDSMTSNAGS